MTTTTKNAVINKRAPRKKGVSKQRINKPPKNDQIDHLNSILEEIAIIKGWKNFKVACRKMGIPTNSGKITTKQLSGYIGMLKSELRKLKQ